LGSFRIDGGASNAAVERVGKRTDGVRIGRGERFDLDSRQLIALLGELAQDAARVFYESLAHGGVGRQPPNQRFDIPVGHGKQGCGLRSGPQAAMARTPFSGEVFVSV
jgi:hypothetical protein